MIVRHNGLSTKRGPDSAAAVRALVRDNRVVLDRLAPNAEGLFDVIGLGESAENARVEPLIADRSTHATLQKVADELLELIEDDIESPEAGAYIYMVGFIGPYVKLSTKTLKHLLRRLPKLIAETDDKLEQKSLRIKQGALAKLRGKDEDEDEDDDDDDDDDDAGSV